jgi:predicted DsbA family dithiol-disulfide isomerase
VSAVTIDIWSDVMCPWCVIGTRNLETALAGLQGEIAATIRFHPFELNPDMPAQGEDQRAHIMRKYGRSAEQAAEGREQLRAIGARAGYAFDYTGLGEPPPAMMWNTRAAHKLLTMTLRDHGAEVQVRLKHALFDAHFQARRNVSDPQVLADVAQSVGLDRAEALAAIGDAELDGIVSAGERMARERDISAVPAMVINGKYMVPGAQDPETYASVLRRVVAREG